MSRDEKNITAQIRITAVALLIIGLLMTLIFDGQLQVAGRITMYAGAALSILLIWRWW